MENVWQKKMEKGDLWHLEEKSDQELFQSSSFV